MRYKDVQMLSQALEGMRRNILAQKMAEQQEEQRKLDNDLRAEMTAYQKERDRLGDQRYDADRSYRQGRDAITDGRWREELDYRKGRDERGDTVADRDFGYRVSRDRAGDSKDARNFGYQVGRDQSTDERANQQFALQAMALKLQQEGRNRAMVVDDVDPTTGTIDRRRITRPYGGETSSGGAPMRELGDSQPTAAKTTKVPQEAIEYLNQKRNDPRVLEAFRRKYGVDPQQYLY